MHSFLLSGDYEGVEHFAIHDRRSDQRQWLVHENTVYLLQYKYSTVRKQMDLSTAAEVAKIASGNSFFARREKVALACKTHVCRAELKR